MKILSFLLKLVLFFCIFLVAIGYLNFLHPLFDSIAQFRLHLLFIAIFLSIVFLVISKNRLLYGILFGLLMALLAENYIAFSRYKVAGKRFTHMQFNINFNNKNLDKLSNFIKDKRPDIITLQEVTTDSYKNFQKLKNIYPYQRYCSFYTEVEIAIFSKYPFIGQEVCAKDKGMLISKVKIYNKELTVASIHLVWPYPYPQDRQIELLKPYLLQIKAPAIISGDFNSAYWSYSVQKITKLSNTKVAKGVRWSFELKSKSAFLPSLKLPIDQLLISNDIVIKDIKAENRHLGSDHYPILSVLTIERDR